MNYSWLVAFGVVFAVAIETEEEVPSLSAPASITWGALSSVMPPMAATDILAVVSDLFDAMDIKTRADAYQRLFATEQA